MKKHLLPLFLIPCICFLPELRAEESQLPKPGMLGVALHEVTTEDATLLRLPGVYGAWVRGLGPDSPAANAGLQENDVIVSYNGERVESARALQRMVIETPAGRNVELRVIRDGKAMLAQPILGEGELPPSALAAPRAPKSLGLGIETLAPAIGQYLGLEEGVGVIVRAVKEDSPASEAGLQEKDILVKINETGITSAQHLAELIKGISSYHADLTIVRGTETQTIQVQL